MKKILVTAGLAAMLGALAAQAQVPTGMNDLVLGFKTTASSFNLMVNLGSFEQFDSAGATVATNWSLDVGGLLTQSYGADWATQSGLNWGIAGTQGSQDAERTSYVTSQWSKTVAGTLGVKNSVAWGAINASGSASAAVNIGKPYQGMSRAGGIYTIAPNAVLLPTSNGSSWSAATTTGGAFVIYNPQLRFQNQTNNLALGMIYSASDLYKMDAGLAGQFEGTFALDQMGLLTYTAVPEPSTYAMIIGGLALGVVGVRRRRVKQD